MMRNTEVETILGAGIADRLRRPIAEARGLPGAAYTSPAFFELEMRRLFRRSWVAVAFAEEVGKPGDAMPLSIAGVPIILVRGEDGVLRGFHNVCRHRAAEMLAAPAHGLKHLTCPYHAWAYDLTGALRAIPYFDGTRKGEGCPLDRAANGLVPVRVEVWQHWVFVDLEGRAPPLEQHLRPLVDLISGFDIADARIGHRVDWDLAGNWKLQNDNWETYHHVWVHEGVFDRMSDDLELATGRPWTETLAFDTVVALRRREGAPRYAGSDNGLPPVPTRTSPAPARRCTSLVFPNLTLTIAPDHLASVITEPLAPDRTRMKLAFFFVGEAAHAPAMAAGRSAVLDRWLGPSRRVDGRDGIRSQDMAIWEGQQRARHSPAADDVKFSSVWEANVYRFQNWLVDQLEA